MHFNLDFEDRTQCNILSEAVGSFISYLEAEITMVEKSKHFSRSEHARDGGGSRQGLGGEPVQLWASIVRNIDVSLVRDE